MTASDAINTINWILGILTKTSKLFGCGVINEAILRKDLLGGKAGWYVIPVCSIAAGAGIAQAVTSLGKYKKSKVIKKAYKGLIKFERFLDIHGMLVTTLLELVTAVFPGDVRIAFIIAEVGAGPFALWRAYKCKQYWIAKLEPLSGIARSPSERIDVELQRLPAVEMSASRFSLSDFKRFVAEHHHVTEEITVEGEDQTNIHEYLEEYFYGCVKGDSKQFWHIFRDSLAYGGEVACSVSFFMFLMKATDIFDIGLYSVIFSAIIFLMASAVGYSLEKTNSLLLEINTSDLLTNPELCDDIHELLIKFYDKSVTKLRIFAQIAEGLKNALITLIGLLFMVTTPSLNDENGSTYVPEWYDFIAIILAMVFGAYSIRNVKQEQSEMLSHTGIKNALEKLESDKSSEAVEIDHILPAAQAQTIATPPKGVKSDAAEQLRLSGGDSPESSASSSVSDSPPESRSLPVNTLIPITTVTIRAQSIASEGIRDEIRAPRSHHKQGWGEWFKHTFFGESSSTQRRELAQELLSPADRTDESQPAGARV